MSELLVGIVGAGRTACAASWWSTCAPTPRSDRFAPGAALTARRAGRPDGVLTVTAARPHSGRLLVRFAEAADRDAAEALRGTRLLIDAADLARPATRTSSTCTSWRACAPSWPTAPWWARVREVVHGPGGELLVLARPDAPDALVPFVAAIVPTVDLRRSPRAHPAGRPARPLTAARRRTRQPFGTPRSPLDSCVVSARAAPSVPADRSTAGSGRGDGPRPPRRPSP